MKRKSLFAAIVAATLAFAFTGMNANATAPPNDSVTFTAQKEVATQPKDTVPFSDSTAAYSVAIPAGITATSSSYSALPPKWQKEGGLSALTADFENAPTPAKTLATLATNIEELIG